MVLTAGAPAGPNEPAAPVSPGEMLAGKYLVERVLGAGGMGVVVAARHIHLDQRVAIKFLLPHATSNAEVVARFAREARAAAKIHSEHVARVIDVGELPTGAPYMVMEYLDGCDLSQVLASHGPLPADLAAEYVLQACEAIAEAHAAGIVHRDLKPANLFLTHRADGSPIVKVLDFGISKAAQDASTSGADIGLTKTSTMMGSPLYMSPEQMKSSRDVDARTDIWSIGVILYELLAGHPAFQGTSITEVLARIMTEEPTPLGPIRPDLPLGLERVVLGCLEKQPNARVPNVVALANALGPYAGDKGKVSVGRITGVMQAAGLTGQAMAHGGADAHAMRGSTAGPWGPAQSQPIDQTRPSSIGSKVLFGAVVLGLAVGVLIFALRIRSAKPPAPEPSGGVVMNVAPAAAPMDSVPAATPPPQPVVAAPAPVPTPVESAPAASASSRPSARTGRTPAAAHATEAKPPPVAAAPPPPPTPLPAPPPPAAPTPVAPRNPLKIDIR